MMVFLLYSSLLLGVYISVAVSRNFTNIDYYQPTAEELERAVAVSPPSYWGKDIFMDQKNASIRVIAIGGSNTAAGQYVSFLDKSLRGPFSPDSYVENGGMAGTTPQRRKFRFETAMPVERWPNVIILEYAVNSRREWESVKDLEMLISFMNDKYVKRKLHLPHYIIFELLDIQSYYMNWDFEHGGAQFKPECDDIVIEENPNMESALTPHIFDPVHGGQGFNHGDQTGPFIGTFAKFYRYPMISIADSMWPSFVRYYQTHLNCSLWPYSHDGRMHLSEFGFHYIVDNIFIPFFVNRQKYFHVLQYELAEDEKSKRLKEMERTEYADKQGKMFPLTSSFYKVGGIIGEWNSWGHQLNTLHDVLLGGPGGNEFSFKPINEQHDDGGHICYRSESPSGVFRSHFRLPERYFWDPNSKIQEKVVVTLSLEMIHSWNKTFIGDLSCQIYQSSILDGNNFWAAYAGGKDIKSDNEMYAHPILPKPKIIHGNKLPHHEAHQQSHHELHDTVPRLTVLTSELHFGNYMLECKKMDPRVVCITKVTLTESI
jgi:hypothetical protein